MAQYVVLIYESESDYANAAPEVYGQIMDAHNRFAEKVIDRGGKIAGGNALQGTDTATSIRGDVVTDGPFVETKEMIGGYAIFELRNKEEAMAAAREFMQLHLDHMPGWEGTCEVRMMASPEAANARCRASGVEVMGGRLMLD